MSEILTPQIRLKSGGRCFQVTLTGPQAGLGTLLAPVAPAPH